MISFIARYNKFLVALTMAVIYFLNSRYGFTIPISETDVNTVWMIVSACLVWLIPNGTK